MTKLKEMLVRSELNEKQITGLKQRLAYVENNLQQAERNNQELTVSFISQHVASTTNGFLLSERFRAPRDEFE